MRTADAASANLGEQGFERCGGHDGAYPEIAGAPQGRRRADAKAIVKDRRPMIEAAQVVVSTPRGWLATMRLEALA